MADDRLHYGARIPTQQIEAAQRFGKMIAQGVIEASECLPWLIEAVEKTGQQVGTTISTALSWTLLDSAERWEGIRSRTELDVRKAVLPLLNNRELPEVVVAAAFARNTQAGEPMLTHEVRAIVGEEVDWWVRRNMPRRRHAR